MITNPCPSSGFQPGATKWTRNNHRRGWCPHCDRWRPLTPGGKFKKHSAPVSRAS